jgi:hypothetical protein
VAKAQLVDQDFRRPVQSQALHSADGGLRLTLNLGRDSDAIVAIPSGIPRRRCSTLRS